MDNSFNCRRIYLIWLASVIFHLVLILVLTLWGLESSNNSFIVLELESSSTMLKLDELQFETPEFPESDTEYDSSPRIEELLNEISFGSNDAPPSPPKPGPPKKSTALTNSTDFKKLVANLNENGLDLVIVFDSTSSMGSEIYQMKSKVRWMCSKLLKVVDNTRIGVGSYRDLDDAKEPGSFVVSGVPLTDRPEKLFEFLDGIHSEGGGRDTREAVHRGLDWAIEQNTFRPESGKVILLFGDAPPYRSRTKYCIQAVSKFKNEQNGRVSTITCKQWSAFHEFAQIAHAGGGESLLMRDAKQGLMVELLVLVFGNNHREHALAAIGREDE